MWPRPPPPPAPPDPDEEQRGGVLAFAKRHISCVVPVANLMQGIVLIVLLILAPFSVSPTDPGRSQAVPTDSCSKPMLFQTWMSLSVVRLIMAFLVHAWLCLRQKRRDHAAEVEPELSSCAAAASLAESGPNSGPNSFLNPEPNAAHLPARPMASVSSPALNMPQHRRSSYRSSYWASTTSISPLEMSQLSPNASTPSLMMTPRFSPVGTAANLSSPSLMNLATPIASPPTSASQSTPSLATTSGWRTTLDLSKPAEYGKTDLAVLPQGLAVTVSSDPSLASLHQRRHPTGSAFSLATSRRFSQATSNNPAASAVSLATTKRQSQATSLYPAPYLTSGERRRLRHAAWWRRLDLLAPDVGNITALWGFLLFFLGHPLLFVHWGREQNCYHGAPLLWWGTMMVVATGWVRVLWIIGSLVIVSVGAVLAVAWVGLCVLCGWHTTLRPERPRTPQPEPLNQAELLRCEIVCYVPDPSDPPGAVPDSPKRSTDAGEPVATRDVDASRLSLPHVVLPASRATCGICQENFRGPRDVPRRIMYDVAALRKLPCNHVFHQDCIDNWLLNHSGKCPYCNLSVREMLKMSDEKAGRNRTTPSRDISRSATPA